MINKTKNIITILNNKYHHIFSIIKKSKDYYIEVTCEKCNISITIYHLEIMNKWNNGKYIIDENNNKFSMMYFLDGENTKKRYINATKLPICEECQNKI